MALQIRHPVSDEPTTAISGDGGGGDVFEFASHVRAEMSAADELFHRGQLISYRSSSSYSSHLPPTSTTATRASASSPRLPPLPPRRCSSEDSRRASRPPVARHVRAASLDEMERSRSSGAGGALLCWKGSAQDYQKLPPASAVEAAAKRSQSRSPAVAPQSPPRTTSIPRPKWYVVVFGTVKVPSEMEMRDIRNRHRRRTQTADSGGGGNGCAGHWKLLRSLSCKCDVDAIASTSSRSLSGR